MIFSPPFFSLPDIPFIFQRFQITCLIEGHFVAECGCVVAGCGWTTSLWFGSRDLVGRSSLDVFERRSSVGICLWSKNVLQHSTIFNVCTLHLLFNRYLKFPVNFAL